MQVLDPEFLSSVALGRQAPAVTSFHAREGHLTVGKGSDSIASPPCAHGGSGSKMEKNLKVGGDDGIDNENRAGEAGGGSHGGAGPSAANSGPAGAGWSETAEQRQ